MSWSLRNDLPVVNGATDQDGFLVNNISDGQNMEKVRDLSSVSTKLYALFLKFKIYEGRVWM